MLVYTTVSPEYCPNWGIKEALRELFQEAIDVKHMYNCSSEVYYDFDTNSIVIQDDGPGIQMSSLVMGKSGKRSSDVAIGQFGEGMKLGCLILARNGRKVVIETAEHTIRPVIAVSPDFGCEVLAFDIYDNDRERGTIFRIEVTFEEYKSAADLFIELGARDYFYVPEPDGTARPVSQADQIFLPGGKLFVQGVAVSVPQGDPLLFSYNIPSKCIQGRDRWAIDIETLRTEITRLWANCTNRTLIRKYLKAIKSGERYLEITFGLLPDFAYDLILDKQLWADSVKEILSNYAVSSYQLRPPQLQRCHELGYEVIVPHHRIRWALEELGIPNVEKLADVNKPEVVPTKKLNPVQKYNFQTAVKLFKRYINVDPDVKFAVATFHEPNIAGTYNNGVIYVSRDILNDIRQLISTLIHEYAHYLSGADDYTSRFQEALEGIATDMILSRSISRKQLPDELAV